MRARFHEAVPGWPPLAGVAALLLVSIAGSVAPLPAAAVGGLAGLDGSTPALTLLAGSLFAGAAALVVVKLAGRGDSKEAHAALTQEWDAFTRAWTK